MARLLKIGGCTLASFVLASNLNLKSASNMDAASIKTQTIAEAQGLAQQGRPDEAMSAIEALILNMPDADIVNNLANLYSKADCCSRQNKFLISLIDKNMNGIENNAELSKAVANALYETAARHLSQTDNKKASITDYAPAIKMLEAAAKLQPENYDVLLELGWAYRKISKGSDNHFAKKGLKAHFRAAALCEKANACRGKMPFITNAPLPAKPAIANSKYTNKYRNIYTR